MADTKVSGLSAATALTGTELVLGVQSATSVKVTINQIKTFTSASPTLITPNLGTPSAGVLTNATGLPISTGVTGLGTGVATALAVNTGSAGAFVVFNGALGTPSSGTATNLTGLPISTGVSGLGTGVATFLGTPSSANLAAAVTDETGSGSLVFATSPTLTTPNIGTPSAGVLTNATGLPLSTGVTGVLPIVNGGTAATTAATARVNLLPDLATNAAKHLAVNGTETDVEWVSAGTLTSVDVSGGTTGLTFSGGPITSSGTITASGTLDVDNGGTGQTSYTNGQLLIGNTTGNTLAKGTLTGGTGITVTNGAGSITIDAVNNGTVTSVSGAGTVSGLTLTGTVTTSGSLTLGGTLSVDLTADVTGILPGANGGTGNGFFAVTGPTTSLKTFTLPDASATILTDNAAVSVAQGGTGQTTYTNGQLLIGNTTGNTLTKATLTAGTGISITNGTGSITIDADNNGTVTSVGGTGTVNGLTLTGTVTTSGNLTLGGTLAISDADWSGTDLAIINGGTGASTAAAARVNLLPSLSANANKVLAVNVGETDVEWVAAGGGGDALTTNPLSQFAATTSAQLAGVISDETGSGALVFGTSPTLASPTTTGLLTTEASDASEAGLRVPHGTAPSTPTNGDIWTTTAGMYAYINGTTVGPFGAGGGASAVDVQTFTAGGTWTKPSGATTVWVAVWGGGSGGASGRKGATSTDCGGGGGGAGGNFSTAVLQASALGATESVTVGAGGTGGAAQTVESTDGNAGGGGGASSFGSWLTSPATQRLPEPGEVGAAIGGLSNLWGSPAGGAGGTGDDNGPGEGGEPGMVFGAPAGGGGGGAVGTDNIEYAGGEGGLDGLVVGATGGGGAAGGGAGASATNRAAGDWRGGLGGAGGGGSSSTNGGAGGNGAFPGGGGGGGGGSRNSVGDSGAGGNGGAGLVVVVTYK